MPRFNPKKIEKKWQARWLKEHTYEPDFERAKRPFYNLMMFPYPSAEGLHVGNMYAFTGTDIYGRFQRMRGFDVFEPIGLDGFGIHSENYAMKAGRHPAEQVKISEKNFYRQLEMIGNGFAWRERLETYDPEYYKWTQWLFAEMFRRGLAYRKKQAVNWCPSCKTVLADEQVEGGVCERCKTKVIKKELEQWFFRITQYAERLLQGLEKIDWSEKVKIAQRNWIGRSEGALIDFEIKTEQKPNFVLIHGYNASPENQFFPWLKAELEKRGFRVQVPVLPHPEDPRVADQVAYVLKSVIFDANTVILGHSLGSVVALKTLEKIKQPVRKTVLVGGFTENNFLDGDNFESYTFDWNFDVVKISKNAGVFISLRDLTDDAVPAYQPEKLIKLFGGTLIDFKAEKPHARNDREPVVLRNVLNSVKVFTTRPDTLFGATYVVLGPEHPLLKELSNTKEVEDYIKKAKAKSDNDRIAEGKEKTGVELKSVRAINPANGEEISVWVADYVLGGVGTSAIMAVPAHDERDFEFANKFGLPIKTVIEPITGELRENEEFRKSIVAIVENPKTGKILSINWGKKFGGNLFIGGGAEDNENLENTARREIEEETGYKDLKLISISEKVHHHYIAHSKGVNRYIQAVGFYFQLLNEENKQPKLEEDEAGKFIVEWISKKEVAEKVKDPLHSYIFGKLVVGTIYTGSGIVGNSLKFTGMESEKAKWKITEFAGGERRMQFRLRDWLISRQRYWGPPIPMIFCESCKSVGKGERTEMPGWFAVPDKDLPVKLPKVEDFRPTGTDKSPLATVEKFYKVRCPECKAWARRETDVSDTFLDSAWYYIGYLMKFGNWKLKIGNSALTKLMRQWLPVNSYIGGAEHSVLHLLYVRFLAKVMHDWELVHFDEPFPKFRAHGLLIKDGAKMSKSRGNVVNPDEYIKAFGADALRMYLMFLGPFEQGGDFRDTGIKGITRFLERVWSFVMAQTSQNSKSQFLISKQISNPKSKILQTLHKTIKKVTEDIENLQYNTAISALMILSNKFEENRGEITVEHISVFLRLLAPFAPHITEELWQLLKDKSEKIKDKKFRSIHLENWPEFDPKLILEDTFELVVQINGKMSDKFIVPIDISEEEATRLTLDRERVKGVLRTLKPCRIIFIPKRLINIIL